MVGYVPNTSLLGYVTNTGFFARMRENFIYLQAT